MRQAESSEAAKEAIREQARSLGFDTVGFTQAAAPADQPARLRAFLDAGMHGDMGWMETTADRRGDPQTLWPEARSAVVVGLNYGPDRNPMAILAEPLLGAVSAYAQTGRDYHDVVKKRLKALARWIVESSDA